MRNKDFRELFMEALKKIGSENFEETRVDEALLDWNLRWSPLLEDYYRRYAADPDYWEKSLADTAAFFKQRYGYLLPFVEAWYALQS